MDMKEELGEAHGDEEEHDANEDVLWNAGRVCSHVSLTNGPYESVRLLKCS